MSEKCCAREGRAVDGVAASRPVPLTFGRRDGFKALYCWLNSFRRTFAITPGLYYLGERYDKSAPLLVTANYHLTVFWLWRVLRGRSVRLLVIDTGGINVWCASGKGQFSAAEIIRRLGRYSMDMLSDDEKLEIILPKLSLSGVRLESLRRYPLRPRVGPVYARDLPAYLDNPPYGDRAGDVFRFDWRDRLFTLPPVLWQALLRLSAVAAALLAWDTYFPTGLWWQVWPLGLLIVVLYIALFPWLPTKRFVPKGLVLGGGLAAAGAALLAWTGPVMGRLDYLFYSAFTVGAAIYFALSYTGDSGVSNYSLVKREVVLFLPVSALLLLGAVAAVIAKGWR